MRETVVEQFEREIRADERAKVLAEIEARIKEQTMTECPVCGRDGCPGVYDGPVTESPIPEKAIAAAIKAENLQVSQWENSRAVLQAALPALHAQWVEEAVARIEALADGTDNLHVGTGIELARLAIKQAPEQEDG